IPLAVHQIGETAGEDPPVIELGDTAAAEAHRLLHGQQHREVGVGVGLVLLYIEAVGTAEQLPVDAADVVAGGVAAVLGEVDGGAEVRRPVHPVDEPVDDRAGDQLEIAHACEDHGVHEACPGQPAGLYFVAHLSSCVFRLSRKIPPGTSIIPPEGGSHMILYIPLRGIGTDSSSLSTSASLVTPSDCAWKLVSTRWRSTGWASARMSSKLT